MRRFPLTAAWGGKSNPKPGAFWKFVAPDPNPNPNPGTSLKPFPLDPNAELLPRRIGRPVIRVRPTGAPVRAALCVPDCTRTLPRIGAPPPREITVPPRADNAGADIIAPPRCCAAANAGIANPIITVIESRLMAEPLPIPHNPLFLLLVKMRPTQQWLPRSRPLGLRTLELAPRRARAKTCAAGAFPLLGDVL